MTTPTKFDNQTEGQIADLIGELDTQTKAIEKRIREAKEELARRGLDHAEGQRFTITRSDFSRWTLIREDVEKALGEAWVQKHSKITPVTTWRTTVVRSSLVDA